MEPFGPLPIATDHDSFGGAPVTGCDLPVDTVADGTEADEVGVRVEDDDAERRLEQQLFEHRPERVALP
jgi:hypothetical protein